MLGAIIGDIVGSRFEFENVATPGFQLFSPDCSYTDAIPTPWEAMEGGS